MQKKVLFSLQGLGQESIFPMLIIFIFIYINLNKKRTNRSNHSSIKREEPWEIIVHGLALVTKSEAGFRLRAFNVTFKHLTIDLVRPSKWMAQFGPLYYPRKVHLLDISPKYLSFPLNSLTELP